MAINYAKVRSASEQDPCRAMFEIVILIFFSLLITSASVAASGLQFANAEGFFTLFGGMVSLLIVINIYQFIRMPENTRIITFFNMTIIYLIMAINFMIFQYSLALFKAYPITETIEKIDHAVGFDYIDFISRVNGIPYASAIIGFCYKNWMREFVVVFAVLSYLGKFRSLNEFTASYIIAGMSTLAVSGLLDARSIDGVSAFDIAGLHHPSGVSPVYLDKLDHLRRGLDNVMDFHGVIGLVSFPSFHAGAAVLLATATRNLKWLWLPFLCFNVLILIGTITEGGHNLCDVIAGCVFSAAAIAVAEALHGSTVSAWLIEEAASRFQPWLRPRAS